MNSSLILGESCLISLFIPTKINQSRNKGLKRLFHTLFQSYSQYNDNKLRLNIQTRFNSARYILTNSIFTRSDEGGQRPPKK